MTAAYEIGFKKTYLLIKKKYNEKKIVHPRGIIYAQGL